MIGFDIIIELLLNLNHQVHEMRQLLAHLGLEV